MYEDDEGRIAAAEQLAEHDPRPPLGGLILNRSSNARPTA
jgi:hypothetical protein